MTEDQNDTESPSYFLSEGVAGQGESPEWFKSEKYKTVADQAKAYREVESKISEYSEKMKNFDGAPDAYNVDMPDGFSLSEDDPLLEKAKEWGKSLNLSQEGFSSLIGMYTEIEAAKSQALEDAFNEEVAKIDNFDQRSSAINNFLNANDMGDLAGVITSKEQLEQFEALLNMAGSPSLDPDTNTDNAPTDEEIDKLMFELDENGRQIYSYSQERQEKVRKMLERKVGKGTYSQVVG